MELEKLELYELYYLLIISEIYDDEDIVTWDIEELKDIIVKRYLEANGEDAEINNENIFRWLGDNCRYKVLDELLLRLYNRFINIERTSSGEFDNRDLFFVNNIKEMKRLMEEEEEYAYSMIQATEYDHKTKMDKWQVIDTVRDILREIDSSSEWVEIYDQALQGNIIYLNELSDEEKERFVREHDFSIDFNTVKNCCIFGGDLILLTYNGDISDVGKTVHEIIHYISNKSVNDNKGKIIFRELPSIFYEMYALDYLVKLGYDEKEINELKLIRLMDTFYSCIDAIPLVNYLAIMINKGNITEDDVFNECVEYEKQCQMDMSLDEIKLESIIRCDKCIDELTRDMYVIFKHYPYIIGTYLAFKCLDKVDKDELLMTFMKYLTEHIDTICEEDVFRYILDGKIDLYEEEQGKKKRRKRKK